MLFVHCVSRSVAWRNGMIRTGRLRERSGSYRRFDDFAAAVGDDLEFAGQVSVVKPGRAIEWEVEHVVFGVDAEPSGLADAPLASPASASHPDKDCDSEHAEDAAPECRGDDDSSHVSHGYTCASQRKCKLPSFALQVKSDAPWHTSHLVSTEFHSSPSNRSTTGGIRINSCSRNTHSTVHTPRLISIPSSRRDAHSSPAVR